MMKPTAIGERKMKHAREMALLLLLAFIVAIFAKAPAELFITFCTGLGVQSGAFIWGNAQEHKAKGVAAAAGSPTQTP